MGFNMYYQDHDLKGQGSADLAECELKYAIYMQCSILSLKTRSLHWVKKVYYDLTRTSLHAKLRANLNKLKEYRKEYR